MALQTEVELEVSTMAIEPRVSSKQIGDKAPKAEVATVAALMVGFCTEAALLDANHAMNKSHLSGKKLGALVGSGSGAAITLYVAMGADNKSVWTKQGVAGAKTPVGALPAAGVLGDKRRKATANPATALELPVVTTAMMSSGNDPLNHTALSGKKAGAMVIEASSGVIHIAEGSLPTSKWTPQSDTGAIITPTAATPVVVGKVGDKPRKAKTVIVCAVHVPIVAQAELTAKASTLNDTKLSGKALGSVVATTTTGVTSLFMAVGSTDVATWENIKSDVSVTPA